MESPGRAKVLSLCQLERVKTTPVRLYARANEVVPTKPLAPMEVCGRSADMDLSVVNLDALKRKLGLEFEQWCSTPEEDLRALAAERLIRMDTVSHYLFALLCY